MSEAVQKAIDALRLVLTWWFFVEPWEQAIRLRAGKHMRVMGPGVHFRVPFLDSVYTHNMRRTVIHCPSVTASSSDGRVFTIGVAASFCVADVLKLHTEVHDPESVIWQRIAQATADYVHGRSSADIRPAELGKVLDGIDLSDMGLKDAQICVCNFASLRAFRVVNDSMNSWGAETNRVSTTRKA